jgi:hypothetical protein
MLLGIPVIHVWAYYCSMLLLSVLQMLVYAG